jgi:hypothetical protein
MEVLEDAAVLERITDPTLTWQDTVNVVREETAKRQREAAQP